MKSILQTSLVGVLFLTVACGAQKKTVRSAETVGIVGGSAVETRDQLTKSIVAIVSEKNPGQALCTGTLLGKDVVLTAAHCVDGSPAKVMIVFSLNVGQAKLEEMRVADTYVQNERWKKPTSDGSGDLALIHFEGGVPKGFGPVKLAPKTFKLEKGASVTFAGYGVTNGRRETGAGQLRETETTVIGDYTPTEIITDGHKRGVCFGDSGGPAFALQDSKVVQWGVASSVTNQSCKELAIHTGVMAYRTWITAKIRELRGHEE